MKRTWHGFLSSALCWLLCAWLGQSTPTVAQDAVSPQSPERTDATGPQEAQKTTAHTAAEDADSIEVPDGTAIHIRVLNGFSSASAGVGDDIHFEVVSAVKANELVVIPRRMGLTAKVVAVKHSGHFAKNGHVVAVYDALTLPSGEKATVRLLLKPRNKAAKAGEVAGQAVAVGALTFITAGMLLPAMTLSKGHDDVVTEGTMVDVYLNGPLRVSKKAVISVQSTLLDDHAYVDVFWTTGGKESVTTLFCGQRLVIDSSGTFQLEMHPGTYWFRQRQDDQPVRVELLPGHEYTVLRNPGGLHVEEFHPGKDGALPSQFTFQDLTKLAPEKYKALTVEPDPEDDAASPAQKP